MAVQNSFGVMREFGLSCSNWYSVSPRASSFWPLPSRLYTNSGRVAMVVARRLTQAHTADSCSAPSGPMLAVPGTSAALGEFSCRPVFSDRLPPKRIHRPRVEKRLI